MLFRKLVRELIHQKWQFAAVAGMLIMGVAFFGSSYIAYLNLHNSYEYSYEQLEFENFGVRIQPAPSRIVDRLTNIPGIKAAEGRLQEDVSVEIPGRESQKLIGRLISLPTPHQPKVNQLVVLEGNNIRSPSAREVLLESKFAEYHGLRPGHEIEVNRLGDKVRLRIAGIVASPEYIYVVRSKQDLMPTPDTFGVMFLSEDVLGTLVGKRGMINEIRFTTIEPVPSQQTLRAVTDALVQYRSETPILREDQPSHQLLRQDLEGFQVFSILFPIFFLGVAAVTVYTILSRLVTTQQPIIGLLRSLGVTRSTIAVHYLSSAILVGAISAVIGSALGLWFSRLITLWYFTFISVPYARFEAPIAPLLVGAAAGIGCCLIASIFPTRVATSIQPAEAMRPAPPTVTGAVTIDRLFASTPLLWRLPIRNIFRHPKRLASSLFGIASSIALIMTGLGLLDSMDEAMSAITGGAFESDLTVGFLGIGGSRELAAISALPGVIKAEGVLELPIEFRKGGREYFGLLVGADPDSMLFGIEDDKGSPIPLTSDLVMGPTLRSQLKLERGDMVTLSLPSGEIVEEPSTIEKRVYAFNWEPMGTIAYTSRDEVWRMFRTDLELPPGAVTSARVIVDPERQSEVRQRIDDMPTVASVTSDSDIQEMIDELMQSSRTFIGFMVIFGMALAFSVVFNVITINVTERTQEIATMRTVGITFRSIVGIITLENILISLIGIAIGLPLGKQFVHFFMEAAQTEEQAELFTMRVFVHPNTYIFAAVIVLATVLLSQIPSIQRIAKINLAKAINERTS